jgi:hypothetical protein
MPIRLNDVEHQLLDQLARKEGISKADWLRLQIRIQASMAGLKSDQ